MTTTPMRVQAVVAHARRLPGQYFLAGEASAALGVSASTLRRLAATNNDKLSPVRSMPWGSTEVALYDMDTVERLHVHLAAHKTDRGHPRLWTDEELRQRRASYSTIGYRRRKAVQLWMRGHRAEAAQLAAEAERLHQDLLLARRARLARVRQAGRRCDGTSPTH